MIVHRIELKDWTAFVTSIGTVVAAIASVLAVVLSIINTFEIKQVAHNTNSIKDELVAEVRAAAEALGVKKERARAKEEKNEEK